MSAKTELRVVSRAPAKINLFLDVLGQRENGYHDIRSVLVPVSLHDEVSCSLLPEDAGIELELTYGDDLPKGSSVATAPEMNLAVRAAKRLQDVSGSRKGARIHLKKHIPIGGGLGGGSSDAATVLRVLNELWGTGLSRDELADAGSSLGCDIPALVHGGAVLMEGLGELVRPALSNGDRPASWWLVLANPCFSVSTADIYARCGVSLTSEGVPVKHIISALAEGSVSDAAGGLFNRLQETVVRKYPLIRILMDALADAGALGTLVSGSGSTVFGLARGRDDAYAVAGAVEAQVAFPVWTKVVRLLPDSVMAAHGPLEA